jgi:YesN/AraC family two-component response regulator
MNILIVDDEPLVVRAVKRTLYDLDGSHHVSTAESGDEALRIMERNPCEVVVVDMRMPDMSGLELLSFIRARWPDTYRIVLSGYADNRTVREATAIAHRFLAKPCAGQVLRDAILGAAPHRA